MATTRGAACQSVAIFLLLLSLASPSVACAISRSLVPITPTIDSKSIPESATIAKVTLLVRHDSEPRACGPASCEELFEFRIDALSQSEGLRVGDHILVPFFRICDHIRLRDGSQDVVLRTTVNPLLDQDPLIWSLPASKRYSKINDEAHRAMRAFNIEVRYAQPE